MSFKQRTQSVVGQRLGKRLFSKQRKCHFRDNGEMKCSTRCPLFGTPSRFKAECDRTRTLTLTLTEVEEQITTERGTSDSAENQRAIEN
jgi:ribosomal protein S18